MSIRQKLSHNVITWMAFLMAAVTTPAGGAAGAPAVDPRAWTELDIVPMPKEIRLTDNDLLLDPDRVALVIGAAAGRQSGIGAEWINQRLAEVGGTAELPILRGTEIPSDKTVLIIGTAEDNPLIAEAMRAGIVNVGTGNPGERGYEIRRSTGGKRIYLAGADPIGALYACVTFGELLERREEKVFWRAAEVRDAPDLVWLRPGGFSVGANTLPELFNLFRRLRAHDDPPPDLVAEYTAAIQDHYDRLLRRKFTLMHYHSYRPGLHNTPLEPVRGTAIIRAGIDYGRERGIEALLYAEKPYAGLKAHYPDLAAERECPTRPGPHRHNDAYIRCWSAPEDVYRATARNLAEWIRATGITHVGFHDTDTGLFDNPAQWAERCDVCRERWGDDYTAATIHKHRIYYEEIKRLNPDARLHFTVYPYTAQVFDPELSMVLLQRFRRQTGPEARELAEGYQRQYTEFFRRLHEAFPLEDVTFCIREAPEHAVQAVREVMPERGVFTWLGMMSHGWLPLFSEAATWGGTFVENPRDIIGVVAYLNGFVPLEGYALREYTWNKATPGARPWARMPYYSLSEAWRHAEPHGEIYDLILPRLARNFFGRRAAPYITRAVSQNIDLQQIFDRQRRQFTWLTDAGRMQWQADNAARAAQAMDELWEHIAADPEQLGLDAFALRRVINLRERLRMGLWAARARAEALRAHEMALQREREAAEAAVELGLEYVRNAQRDRERLLEERPADPILEAADWNPYAGAWRTDMADRVEFTPIEERLKRMQAEIPVLSDLGSIPARVVERLAKRSMVSAHRTTASLTFDEATLAFADTADLLAAWRRAMPVETLMVLEDEARPARAQTRARMLYDDDHLYIAIECRAIGNREVEDRDRVEVFLSPEETGTYAHFLIDADGTLRRQSLPNGSREEDGQNQGLEHAVLRGSRHWTALLKIPAGSSGGTPGAGDWRINIARAAPLPNGNQELSSIQAAGAGSFHDLSRAPRLTWTEEEYPPLQAAFEAPGFKVTTMTLPETIASVAAFELVIETDRVLHDVRMRAEAYDAAGRLQASQALNSPDSILYRWESPGAYAIEYSEVQEKGGLRILLDSPDGTAEHWLRFGGWEEPSAAPPAPAPAEGPITSTRDVRPIENTQHVRVYYREGGWAGWPANHGIWSWGDEILVGFVSATHQDKPVGHTYDPATLRHMFARSLDGGETWTIEDAYEQGITGAARCHILGDKAVEPTACEGGIDFTHPDFALTFAPMHFIHGPSHFYYSYDRGRSWQGPYLFPDLDTSGIANRTEYLVEDRHTLLAFLTATANERRDRRTACARTRDGGRTWERVSWIGEETHAFMPAAVRRAGGEILAVNRLLPPRIEPPLPPEKDRLPEGLSVYRSGDQAASWQKLGTLRPGDLVSGFGYQRISNPPALLRLADGRILLVYGVRLPPAAYIAARLSKDGGRTWSQEIVLRGNEDTNADMGYCRAVQRPDGKVVVVYYFNHARSEGPPYRYIAATLFDPPALETR